METLGTSQGYVGATSGSLLQVYNVTETLYGVVGASFWYNLSAFMVVPPSYYFKINYTGVTEFQGTYSSTFGGGNSISYTFNSPLYVNGNTVYLDYNAPLYLNNANALSSTGGVRFIFVSE